ncbi:MAG: methyltransferase domain-containing protein [Haloferacaceae archaeon]
MTEERAFEGWDDVDSTGGADSFRDYLQTVTGVESVRALKRRSYELLSPAAGERLVDVGCGTGDDVGTLVSAVGPDGAVVGVDNSSEMVETARERAGDESAVSFRVADAESLPFDDDAFDGARADRVLQHLEWPREAFAELCRVTGPGGRVVVTDSDWGTLAVDAPEAELDGLTARILDPEWSCARNGRLGRRLRRWAADAGLSAVDVDAGTIAVDGFETADEVLGLTGRVETMCEAGALSAEEGERWLEALREADESHRFFSSLSLVTVAGTVPDASE